MMDFYRMQREKLVGLLAPALFIAAAIMLSAFVDENPDRTAAVARGIFGPTSWPSYMLYAVVFFAAGWLLQDLLVAVWKFRTARSAGVVETHIAAAAKRTRTSLFNVVEGRVLIGIAIIGTYGYLIPIIGFAFATLLFFVIWFVLGNIRKPAMIGLVSLFGTVFMLYLFVKLASMPLSRGEGAFAELTIAIYRFLKVF